MRFQILSSVATRKANRLQTRDKRTKDATSTMAVWKRISIRTSDGMAEIGQGGLGDPSVRGSAAGTEKGANEVMSCEMVDSGGPPRE